MATIKFSAAIEIEFDDGVTLDRDEIEQRLYDKIGIGTMFDLLCDDQDEIEGEAVKVDITEISVGE